MDINEKESITTIFVTLFWSLSHSSLTLIFLMRCFVLLLLSWYSFPRSFLNCYDLSFYFILARFVLPCYCCCLFLYSLLSFLCCSIPLWCNFLYLYWLSSATCAGSLPLLVLALFCSSSVVFHHIILSFVVFRSSVLDER